MSVQLLTDTPELFADIADIIRLFLGDVKVAPDAGALVVKHEHTQEGQLSIEQVSIQDHKPVCRQAAAELASALIQKRNFKRLVKNTCYDAFVQYCGVHPPWGSLTGIRPTRLMYELLEQGHAPNDAARQIAKEFDVAEDKTELLLEIICFQSKYITREADEFDLYIGIPFCTTRCTYCSFSSGELGDGKLVEPYVDALVYEMGQCAKIVRDKGLKLRAAYMGGGTPTALSAKQLNRVLESARTQFPGGIEWTVEAGRPDTITKQKLQVVKSHGVDRISINPQTFSDETLQLIGRQHTALDTVKAFEMARENGFDHINMDLIAALPEETIDIFTDSVGKAVALNPESITVHTLALKRASKLREDNYMQSTTDAADKMVKLARETLAYAGYSPYYMYRQKYMSGNLENVGYAKPDCACVYNIDIMEETTPILAVGANAITKWVYDREKRIERAANVRNIEHYIARIDEMVERKRKLIL